MVILNYGYERIHEIMTEQKIIRKQTSLSILEIFDSVLNTPVNISDPLEQARFLINDSALPGRTIEQLCDNKLSHVTINHLRSEPDKYVLDRCKQSTIDTLAFGYQRLIRNMQAIADHLKTAENTNL